MEKDFIKGIAYTKFDEHEGPVSYIWVPEHLSMELRQMILLKSTGLLAGEKGAVPKSLAILPIPSLDLKILIKFIQIEDEKFRGGVNDASLSLIYKEGFDGIFYKYMGNLEQIFNNIAFKIKKLEEANSDKETLAMEITSFLKNIKRNFEELRKAEMQEVERPLTVGYQEPPKDTKLKFKIVVCGDPAVGKTSMILRFTDKAFRRKYIPTIGVNMSTRKVQYKDYLVEFILWDIAGQVKFQKMRRLFYEGTNAQIIVCDLTRQETYDSLKTWFKDVKDHVTKDIPVVIVGNKSDLILQITEGSLKSLANELNCACFMTSALTGQNVDETFNLLAEKLIKYHFNE